MLEDILRDQAVVLRSLADELDAVADAIVRDRYQTVPTSTSLSTYEPQHRPIEDDSPSDLSVAIPDGRVSSVYNMCPSPESRINTEVSLQMARHEARQGKIVALDFGPKGRIHLTPETWDRKVSL